MSGGGFGPLRTNFLRCRSQDTNPDFAKWNLGFIWSKSSAGFLMRPISAPEIWILSLGSKLNFEIFYVIHFEHGV